MLLQGSWTHSDENLLPFCLCLAHASSQSHHYRLHWHTIVPLLVFTLDSMAETIALIVTSEYTAKSYHSKIHQSCQLGHFKLLLPLLMSCLNETSVWSEWDAFSAKRVKQIWNSINWIVQIFRILRYSHHTLGRKKKVLLVCFSESCRHYMHTFLLIALSVLKVRKKLFMRTFLVSRFNFRHVTTERFMQYPALENWF